MSYDLRGDSGGLRGSSKLRNSGNDVNPMANVANLSDAMLVLAVGLMVALVSFWNVNINDVQEIVQQDEVTEVDVSEMADDMQKQGGGYNELGTVYQDPSTGKLYMLTEDADKGASNISGESGSSSSSSK